jgi:hypothetical protein
MISGSGGVVQEQELYLVALSFAHSRAHGQQDGR